jgi:hypothetical protein
LTLKYIILALFKLLIKREVKMEGSEEKVLVITDGIRVVVENVGGKSSLPVRDSVSLFKKISYPSYTLDESTREIL